MNKKIFAFMCLALSYGAKAQNTGTIGPVEKIELHSTILNEDRIITVYRPPAIPQFPESVSPVIYLLDGELVSDMVRAQVGYFCEIWKELPPITVVGIENLPGRTNRTRDLTPTKSPSNLGGGAGNFLKFMTEEIFPLVEKDHKRKPYRILIGSSLAGYFTIYSFLNHTDLFDAYVASSPSLSRNNNEIMRDLSEKLKTTSKAQKILFFAVGNEGSRYVPNATLLDSLLTVSQFPHFRHQFNVYPHEMHGTTPLKSYYDGFRFIFRVGHVDAGVPIQNLTPTILKEYYDERSFIFRTPMKVNEFIVNDYGYWFLYELKQPEKAVEFFKMNVENYPQSANAYDSYAEGLLALGDKQRALANYEKSLKLNPRNTNADQIIVRLKKELAEK